MHKNSCALLSDTIFSHAEWPVVLKVAPCAAQLHCSTHIICQWSLSFT